MFGCVCLYWYGIGGYLLSKRMETGFVVAVAALTVLSMTSAIRDSHTQQSDPVGKWVQQQTSRLDDWIRGKQQSTIASSGESGGHHALGLFAGRWLHPTPKVQPVTTNAPRQANDGTKAEGATRSSASGQPPNQLSALTGTSWSAADVATLQRILTDVVSGMSPTEWQEVNVALTSDSIQQAKIAIVQLLDRHLSPSDKAWLLTHFQGRQAFSADDVQLLQQTLKEIRADLTPGEQSVLARELGSAIGAGKQGYEANSSKS